MPQHLLEGLRRFRATDLARYRELFRRLASEGQRPSALFVACSDSRVVPHLLTGTDPGDLFVVRTIGNIVAPPDAGAGDPTAAAVEFAVATLGVGDVVVCGHSGCGAMKALYDGVAGSLGHLRSWVEHARPAALAHGEVGGLDAGERDRRTAQRNVALSLDRLAAHPLVAERRARGDLALHGWYYDIASAEVAVYDPDTRTFSP